MEPLYPFMIMLVITQLKANMIIQFWRQYFKRFSRFPTSETQLGYYYQNMNIQVNASRIAEGFKTYNYEKSLKSLKPLQKSSQTCKKKFLTFALKNCEKSRVKHSTEKLYI